MSTEGLWLAVDLGTSGVKALVVDASGQVLAQAREEYSTRLVAPGWVEQDPGDWWRAVCLAVRQALAIAPGRRVDGVGLTGQMKGLVLVDRKRRPVRPCIAYTDTRATQETAEIKARWGDELRRRTGGWVRTAATITKLLWVSRHEPDHYEEAFRFLLPKDLIRLRLTGEYATDVTDAAGTLLYDVRGGAWAFDVADQLGLGPRLFPRVLEPAAISGYVTPAASEQAGIPPGTPVVAGAADMACTVLGAGSIEVGDTSITLSSAGQVLTVSRELTGPAGTSPNPHVIPGLFYLMGSSYAGGASLRWARDILRCEGPEAFSLLEAEAAKAPPGCGGMLFLPYLLGAGTPAFDPRVRGAFLGVGVEHGHGHLVRAVMEGVALHLRQCVEIMGEWGLPVRTPVIGAGGARSALWRQIVADVVGRPLRVPVTLDLAGLGAAILAAAGTGAFAGTRAAVQSMARDQGVVVPREDVRPVYDRQYQRFRVATDWLLRSGFDSEGVQ